MPQINTFYSNRIEALFEFLCEHLYGESTPFARRVVVFPHLALNQWVQMRLASFTPSRICFGIEMCLQHEALFKIARYLLPRQRVFERLPSKLDTAFFIQTELSGPDKKRAALSLNMAEEFIHAKLHLLPHLDENELFKKWIKPQYDEIKRYEEALSVIEQNKELHVHLFGINYLDPMYYHFFQQAAKKCCVNHYLLSPSQHFWSDQLNRQELKYLKKKNRQLELNLTFQAWEETLCPFLASLAPLSRKMLKMIECQTDVIEKERYVYPLVVAKSSLFKEHLLGDETFVDEGPFTLLKGIQTHLTLCGGVTPKKIKIKNRDSLQIFPSLSKREEVEKLYKECCNLVKKGVHPSEILVVVPNISSYIPYIEAVFEDSLFDYHIEVKKNHYTQVFLAFLQLAKTPFTPEDILAFVKQPLVSKTLNLKEVEIMWMEDWAKDIVAFSGKEHETHYLKTLGIKKNGQEEKTWQWGFEKLLKTLVQGDLSSHGTVVEITQAEMLGRWIDILQRFESAIFPQLINEQKTFEEWSLYLLKLYETFFSAPLDSDEQQEFEKQLAQFKIYAAGQKISWDALEIYLHDYFSKDVQQIRCKRLDAIYFSSSHVVPAKVVAFMGLGSDFPRGTPSLKDCDKQIFIESLLAAREYLLLFYVNKPSWVIQELNSYLESCCEST